MFQLYPIMFSNMHICHRKDTKMISLKILDVKSFMSKLLIGSAFDTFWLSEASITTFVTYTIDGTLHHDFFDSESAEAQHAEEQSCTTWKEIKPFCFSIMKGKRTPLHFKIVFQLSHTNVQKLLLQSGLSFSPEDIFGLFLNFQFDGSTLTCTTGTSLRFFTMDKTLEHTWEDMLLRFFHQQQIPVENC